MGAFVFSRGVSRGVSLGVSLGGLVRGDGSE